MKTKTLFFILSLFLLFATVSLFASDCGKELNCPSGKKYPYRFCVLDENGETEQITECVEDPLEYEATNPNTFAIKVKLPIYPQLPLFMPIVIYNFCEYRDGETKVVLFETNVYAGYKTAEEELILAADKWNCVCGIKTVSTGGTIVNVDFSINPRDFTDHGFKPNNTPAIAATARKLYYDNENNSYYCNMDYDRLNIYFNATPEFLYNDDKYPPLPNVPFRNGWVAQKYRNNANSPLIPNDVALYNFLEVAMHEIGHILGFGHYTNDAGIECGNMLDGVMNHRPNDIRIKNVTELTQDDKCMMAKLYCPGLVILSIYEYQPQTQRVYPNPGKYVVNFEFELPRHTENFRMYINDVLGQTVLTVLENTVKEAGEHKMLINVDGLAVGTYYIIIEAGSYRTVQPVMIVR